MNDDEWIRRCADRLQEQWPNAGRLALEEAAGELRGSDQWSRFAPAVAAVAWLRLGVSRREPTATEGV